MKTSRIPKADCKNHKALKRVLGSHLDYFERLTNWAEMADWLQKLARHIETYDTLYLPCKKSIAKRLNQCLNIPNLPIGIHRTNMTIYDLVFEILSKRKSALAKNIAIFSFGLFSMFKKAQLEIKHSIIGLFEKYYLPMAEQLVPMLNGLIGCLLSGMNDSETEMKGKILKLLAKVNACVGDHVYTSALWQVLLKNSQTQLQCIKALIHKLEKSKDKLKAYKKKPQGANESIIDNDEKDDVIRIPQKTTMPNLPGNPVQVPVPAPEPSLADLHRQKDSFQKMIANLRLGNQEDLRLNYFPNSCMVVNAIIKCLGNSNVHVVKGILDLLIAYISFKKENSIFTQEEMISIMVTLLRVLKDHDTSVRRRVFQLLFLNKELSKVNLESLHSEHILELMMKAYEYYLSHNKLDEDEINLVFDIIDLFNEQRSEIAKCILSNNAYKFIQFVYLLGYQTINEYTTLVCQRLKKFIVASSQYIEQIIESLAVVIHENSQQIATEVSKNTHHNDDENFGLNRIEKMFIIEFVVKIIINESDIGILKKREYMLLMLRSLLSMFNLFEDGVTHREKNSFVKLLDMITQLLLFLKMEFKQFTVDFLQIWTERGLFVQQKDELALSKLVAQKLNESHPPAQQQSKKEEFLASVQAMIDSNETSSPTKDMKMPTRVICESEFGLKKLNQKRRSILPAEAMFGTALEELISAQFITRETFENECKVVTNLILSNCHSTIVLSNFRKLNYMLLKMEEMTVMGVLTAFRMQAVIKGADKRSQAQMFTKLNRPQKSRITRFTNLSIPDFGETSLFHDQSHYKANDILPRGSELKGPKPKGSESQNPESMESAQIFPNWLLSSLEIIRRSKVEPLVFKVLEFLYSMLDWEKAASFTLSVRYNHMLYKNTLNFSQTGIFSVVLKKLFDLMEVSAYKKVALNYFMSFVMENCDFVIQFIRRKLAQSTARDFRQIASLWKNTSQLNSSTVRKLLGETVFDMLNYADREDPLVRNYFKNWLQYSQKNFFLIVNKLLKRLYLHTNMKQQRGVIVYNFLYDTGKFLSLLRLLRAVFTNGGNSFINFIRKSEISVEFQVYEEEMDKILENFYRNDSKQYYSFILKLLLCYLLSKPNRDLFSQFVPDHDQNNQSQNVSTMTISPIGRFPQPLNLHSTRILNTDGTRDLYTDDRDQKKLTEREHRRLTDCLKESICLFIEKLFESLNMDQDFQLAMAAQKMLRPISFNLEQAIQSNRITLQLEYLNLLSFLMFKTKFARSLGALNINERIISSEDVARVECFAEDQGHTDGFTEVTLADREKEGKRKSKLDSKKKPKKGKRKSKKDSKVERSSNLAFTKAGAKLLANLKHILMKGDFLRILLKGLNNEHTFVMAKYLEYINRLLFMYTKLFSDENLVLALKNILFTYLTIIHENGAISGPLQDLEKRKEKVISLLKGMRFFLEQVLEITHVEIKNERGVEKALLAIFTLGIVSQKENSRKKILFKLEESTCMSLIDSFPVLFNKLLQTYRLTGIIADADVYRMLKDPSFSLMAAEMPLGEGQPPIRQSISESVLGTSVFDTGNLSVYKSNNPFGEGFGGDECFGVLSHSDFSWKNLASISKYVFKIMNPLCNNFVMKSVEALLSNWADSNRTSVGLSGLDLLDFSASHLRKVAPANMRASQTLQGGLKEEDVLRSDLHMKILELVLYNDITPERLLKGVDFSVQMKTIKEQRKKFASSRLSKKILFWSDHAQSEVDLLSFLFAYLKYCCSPKNFFDKEKQRHDAARMGAFSASLLTLLKTFEGVENTLSYMWILDIISVFLDKFAALSSFMGKSRNDWKSFIADIWTKVGKIISDDFDFEFTAETGGDKGDVLVPLRPINPSIRAASGTLKLKLAKHFRGNEEEKDKMFDYVKYKAPAVNTVRYKYFLLITLKKSLYQACEFFLTSSKGGSSKNISLSSSIILQNSQDPAKLNSLMEESSVWSMVRLRPLVEKLLSILKVRKDNPLINQEISEILVVLCSNRSFLADFKQDLLDIFDSDEFFKCDVKTLKMWSKIVDRVLDFSKNAAVVDYYMKNIDFKGVFVFRDTENKKRMKCFLRICFIIYSGDAEKYIDKRALKTLLEKIKNLLKEENSDPRLTILILFSLRILIMRLQKSTLNELFRTIWPSIIFLLRKLIKSKTEKNKGIFLASMKLLELISSTDIEEFNLLKWSFMFEYFGVQLIMVDHSHHSSLSRTEGSYESKPHFIDGPNGEELIGFHVSPFLMAQMPPNTQVHFKLKNEMKNKTYSTYNTTEVIKKRKVVITENSLKEIKLEHKIHEFLTYAVQSSRMDVQIDKEDLECVIEKDFIDFGAYLLG